jgi:hypothetical protein
MSVGLIAGVYRSLELGVVLAVVLRVAIDQDPALRRLNP